MSDQTLVLIERGASGSRVLRHLRRVAPRPEATVVFREDLPPDALAASGYQIQTGLDSVLPSGETDNRIFSSAASLMNELRARAEDWSPGAFTAEDINLLDCMQLDMEQDVLYPALLDFEVIAELGRQFDQPVRLFRTGLGRYDAIATGAGLTTTRTRIGPIDPLHPFLRQGLNALYTRYVSSIIDQPRLDGKGRRVRRDSRRRVTVDPDRKTHVFVIPYHPAYILWGTGLPVMQDLARDSNVVFFSDGYLRYPQEDLERASCEIRSISGELGLRGIPRIARATRHHSRVLRSFDREVLCPWIDELDPASAIAVRQAERYVARGLSRAVLWAKVFSRFLSKTQPDTIVVIPDRHTLTRIAVATADRFGIPSLHIQNSMMSDIPRYGPHPARFGAVMDEYQKSIITNRGGIDPDRIVVTGQPRWDATFQSSTGNDAGLPPDFEGTARTVVLATEALPQFVSDEMVRAVVAALDTHSNVRLVIKVHPREEIRPYEEIIADIRPESVEVEIVKDTDLHPLLSSAHLVMTGWSLVAIEAALLDRPVLSINLTDDEMKVPYVPMGIALGATSVKELGEQISSLLYDEEHRQRLQASRRAFVEANPQYTDGKATLRIADLARRLAATA